MRIALQNAYNCSIKRLRDSCIISQRAYNHASLRTKSHHLGWVWVTLQLFFAPTRKLGAGRSRGSAILLRLDYFSLAALGFAFMLKS